MNFRGAVISIFGDKQKFKVAEIRKIPCRSNWSLITLSAGWKADLAFVDKVSH